MAVQYTGHVIQTESRDNATHGSRSTPKMLRFQPIPLFHFSLTVPLRIPLAIVNRALPSFYEGSLAYRPFEG